MKLFQYWDTGEPPEDVAEWIEGFRVGNPDLEHRLFDRDAASGFIGEHLGARHRQAFDACAVPAMQSDYFRLCALLRFGGVYVDADSQPLQPIAALLERAPEALMFTFDGYLLNGLLMFRTPAHPFVGAYLELATRNIEARRFTNTLMATGPLLADAIRGALDPDWLAEAYARETPEGRNMRFSFLLTSAQGIAPEFPGLPEAFRNITVLDIYDSLRWVGLQDAAYKTGERHWVNWKGPIYRDAPQAKPKSAR